MRYDRKGVCETCGPNPKGFVGHCLNCMKLFCPFCFPEHAKTHAAPVRTLGGEVMKRKPAPRAKKRKPVPTGQASFFDEAKP